MDLVKSKQRVADHGEVFTPAHLVEDMLDLVGTEAERIDSRFLEPACGSGNFLVPVLRRKLTTVKARYGKSQFEFRHHALLALMSIYGIELLPDNVAECRENLLEMFSAALGPNAEDVWVSAATNVLAVNVVHGDALSMTTRGDIESPITFAEWSYLGKGTFQRRDFRFETMTTAASTSGAGTLGEYLDRQEVFKPKYDHGSMSVAEIAAGGSSSV